MASELFTRVSTALGWGDLVTSRDLNIIAHYEREIARGRMSLLAATERAIGDIKGQNRHPAKDQRS